MFEGRLLCPPCAAAQTCTDRGHDYGGPGGWRMCACDRSIPSHADAPPDPAGGDGCGMTWRLCGRCDHIDEHPITDRPDPDDPTSRPTRRSRRSSPADYLRQDVPAGLALPTHIPHPTSERKISRETLMVEPDHPPGHGATEADVARRGGGAR